MGISWDDVVVIEHGKKPGEPSVITVNCPDKAGLGCDLCRIIVEFGLCITKGGMKPASINSSFSNLIASYVLLLNFFLAGYLYRAVILPFLIPPGIVVQWKLKNRYVM